MKRLILALALVGCGTEQTSDLDIVGGQKVYKPWYGRVGGCGSTLIAKRWAISAAHCFNKNTPREVKFGLYRRKDGNGGKPMDVVPVKRIIKHPSWDLALIELKRASKMNPKAFADLKPRRGDKLRAFGFGQTSHPGSAPEFLQGAVFNFKDYGSRPQIMRLSAPGKATCFGDSGGPLIYNGKLVATATYTSGKCNPGGLMGFTRIDMGWVRGYL
jgi:hypothetical protein